MKIVVGILVAVFIALVVVFVPMMEVQDTEPWSYEIQFHVEKSDNRALRSMILNTIAAETDPARIQEALDLLYSIPEFNPVGHVNLRNTDTVQGTFEVRITFTLGERQEAEHFVLQLKPGEEEAVEMSVDFHYDSNWSWGHEVTHDTKLVSKIVPLFEYLRIRSQD